MTEEACRVLLDTGWPWPAIIFAAVVSVFAAGWLDRTMGAANEWLRVRGWLRDVLAVAGCAGGVIPLCAPLGVTTGQWALVSAGAAVGAIVSPWLEPRLKALVKRRMDG